MIFSQKIKKKIHFDGQFFADFWEKRRVFMSAESPPSSSEKTQLENNLEKLDAEKIGEMISLANKVNGNVWRDRGRGERNRVKPLHDLLKSLSDNEVIDNFDYGKYKGWYGQKTRAAVQNLQRALGIKKVDGAFGNGTKNHLLNVLEAHLPSEKERVTTKEIQAERQKKYRLQSEVTTAQNNLETILKNNPKAIPKKVAEFLETAGHEETAFIRAFATMKMAHPVNLPDEFRVNEKSLLRFLINRVAKKRGTLARNFDKNQKLEFSLKEIQKTFPEIAFRAAAEKAPRETLFFSFGDGETFNGTIKEFFTEREKIKNPAERAAFQKAAADAFFQNQNLWSDEVKKRANEMGYADLFLSANDFVEAVKSPKISDEELAQIPFSVERGEWALQTGKFDAYSSATGLKIKELKKNGENYVLVPANVDAPVSLSADEVQKLLEGKPVESNNGDYRLTIFDGDVFQFPKLPDGKTAVLGNKFFSATHRIGKVSESTLSQIDFFDGDDGEILLDGAEEKKILNLLKKVDFQNLQEYFAIDDDGNLIFTGKNIDNILRNVSQIAAATNAVLENSRNNGGTKLRGYTREVSRHGLGRIVDFLSGGKKENMTPIAFEALGTATDVFELSPKQIAAVITEAAEKGNWLQENINSFVRNIKQNAINKIFSKNRESTGDPNLDQMLDAVAKKWRNLQKIFVQKKNGTLDEYDFQNQYRSIEEIKKEMDEFELRAGMFLLALREKRPTGIDLVKAALNFQEEQNLQYKLSAEAIHDAIAPIKNSEVFSTFFRSSKWEFGAHFHADTEMGGETPKTQYKIVSETFRDVFGPKEIIDQKTFNRIIEIGQRYESSRTSDIAREISHVLRSAPYVVSTSTENTGKVIITTIRMGRDVSTTITFHENGTVTFARDNTVVAITDTTTAQTITTIRDREIKITKYRKIKKNLIKSLEIYGQRVVARGGNGPLSGDVRVGGGVRLSHGSLSGNELSGFLTVGADGGVAITDRFGARISQNFKLEKGKINVNSSATLDARLSENASAFIGISKNSGLFDLFSGNGRIFAGGSLRNLFPDERGGGWNLSASAWKDWEDQVHQWGIDISASRNDKSISNDILAAINSITDENIENFLIFAYGEKFLNDLSEKENPQIYRATRIFLAQLKVDREFRGKILGFGASFSKIKMGTFFALFVKFAVGADIVKRIYPNLGGSNRAKYQKALFELGENLEKARTVKKREIPFSKNTEIPLVDPKDLKIAPTAAMRDARVQIKVFVDPAVADLVKINNDGTFQYTDKATPENYPIPQTVENIVDGHHLFEVHFGDFFAAKYKSPNIYQTEMTRSDIAEQKTRFLSEANNRNNVVAARRELAATKERIQQLQRETREAREKALEHTQKYFKYRNLLWERISANPKAFARKLALLEMSVTGDPAVKQARLVKLIERLNPSIALKKQQITDAITKLNDPKKYPNFNLLESPVGQVLASEIREIYNELGAAAGRGDLSPREIFSLLRDLLYERSHFVSGDHFQAAMKKRREVATSEEGKKSWKKAIAAAGKSFGIDLTDLKNPEMALETSFDENAAPKLFVNDESAVSFILGPNGKFTRGAAPVVAIYDAKIKKVISSNGRTFEVVTGYFDICRNPMFLIRETTPKKRDTAARTIIETPGVSRVGANIHSLSVAFSATLSKPEYQSIVEYVNESEVVGSRTHTETTRTTSDPFKVTEILGTEVINKTWTETHTTTEYFTTANRQIITVPSPGSPKPPKSPSPKTPKSPSSSLPNPPKLP